MASSLDEREKIRFPQIVTCSKATRNGKMMWSKGETGRQRDRWIQDNNISMDVYTLLAVPVEVVLVLSSCTSFDAIMLRLDRRSSESADSKLCIMASIESRR